MTPPSAEKPGHTLCAREFQPLEAADRSRFALPQHWGRTLRPFEVEPGGNGLAGGGAEQIHASVLDMNRFDGSVLGRGGVGFGLRLYSPTPTMAGGSYITSRAQGEDRRSHRPEVWTRWSTWEASPAVASAVRIHVDNGGARVRLDGVPIPYRREPWWSEPQYVSGEQHA